MRMKRFTFHATGGSNSLELAPATMGVRMRGAPGSSGSPACERTMMLHLLSESIQSRLHGTCLFYPSSAGDLAEPVHLFTPCIKSFWFVDVGYFGQPGSVHQAKPALDPSQGFVFLSADIRENLVPETDWRVDPTFGAVGPCIRSETYTHLDSGDKIVIHRCRRRGVTALRDLPEPLGVFFYRGDSMEGSRTLWLTVGPRRPRHFLDVLGLLVDGGLVATDGSNCMPRSGGRENPYRHFREIADALRSDENPRDGFSFADPDGRCFRLLGTAASQLEQPTLLWRVRLDRQKADEAPSRAPD